MLEEIPEDFHDPFLGLIDARVEEHEDAFEDAEVTSPEILEALWDLELLEEQPGP